MGHEQRYRETQVAVAKDRADQYGAALAAAIMHAGGTLRVPERIWALVDADVTLTCVFDSDASEYVLTATAPEAVKA